MTDAMGLGVRYLLGVMVASVPWATWLITEGFSAWLCTAEALLCASAIYLFTARGVVSCHELDRDRNLSGWQLILIVFIIMSAILGMGGKSISRWVLICSVSVLNELIFRYVFLFECEIVRVVRPFRMRALIQSALWASFLVIHQCLAGAPINYIIAMMGGYFCLGLIFALLMRKTGTLSLPLLVMMVLGFINILDF